MESYEGRVAVVTVTGRRIGREDTAGPVAFLASAAAAFVIGEALVVDGGLYEIS